jgi:hypothetical protein
LFIKTLLSLLEERHVSLGEKPSMLKARVSVTLFRNENSVRFSKEYWLPLRIINLQKHWLGSK